VKPLVLAFGIATAAFASAAGTEPLANVEIKLLDKLAAKSAGIRTLYVTLYDAESSKPMPYGAMKVVLEKDAAGTVYKGKLDGSNVMMMMGGGGGAEPATLRIKARLDKDGSAGPDAAGDLVGIAEKVKRGGEAVITIDKAL
jgi:hypothetical protein